jgi:hypothetical protein
LAHVFISYVSGDKIEIDRLCNALRKAGLEIWLDREQIKPGHRWKQAIREAIKDGAFFIACFSREYAKREKSYMNEELTFAIDELRQRPTNRAWFIPVLLSEGTVPNRPIGGGETLQDIQWVDLYVDWEAGMRKLISVINPQAAATAEVYNTKDEFFVTAHDATFLHIDESSKVQMQHFRPPRHPTQQDILFIVAKEDKFFTRLKEKSDGDVEFLQDSWVFLQDLGISESEFIDYLHRLESQRLLTSEFYDKPSDDSNEYRYIWQLTEAGKDIIRNVPS